MKKSIKSNPKVKLFLVFPILIIILILSFEKKYSNPDDLIGLWETKNQSENIRMNFKNNRSIELGFISSKVNKIIGVYEVDFLKYPASITITKINNLNLRLYSIIEFINKDKIAVSKFSTRWRLRPISYLKENIILLNRVKNIETI